MHIIIDLNIFFEMALSISKPWYIKNIEFDPDHKTMIFILFLKKELPTTN
jgi:hypothetical protein